MSLCQKYLIFYDKYERWLQIFEAFSENLTFEIDFSAMQSDEAPCVDLSLDYNILVSGCDRANAGIWNLQDGQKTGLLEGHRQALTGVQILPKKSVSSFHISAPLIITSSLDGSLRLWSEKYRVCLAFLKGHRDLVRTIDCTSTRYVSLFLIHI